MLMDHPRPGPIHVDKIPLFISEIKLSPNPIHPLRGSSEGGPGRLSSLHILLLLESLPVCMKDNRSLSTRSVHDSSAVRYRYGIGELAGVEEVVVYGLIVPIHFKVTLRIRDPHTHFVIHASKILEHRIPSSDGRPRAQHGPVLEHNPLALHHGGLNQPVVSGDGTVFLEHLQPAHGRRSRRKWILLENRVPIIRYQHRSGALQAIP